MVTASSYLKFTSGFKPKIKATAPFSRHVDSKSISFLRRFENVGQYRYKKFGSHWISPVLATVAKIRGNYQSLVTRASPDEEEVTDEVLIRILAAVENDSKSAKEMCNAYVEKLCRAGNISAAVQLLQSLRDKKIFLPNAHNCLLVALAETNDINLSFQIFKDLLVSSRTLSSDCYINFARAFMKTNDCTQLLNFIEEIVGIASPECVIVMNRIIFAFGESRQIEKALLIFDHIKGLGCKPDLITYNIVLDILGRVGHVNDMLREFASMKEGGIVPDFISYNTLLNNLRKIGRLDLCLIYFREMGESDIKPDLLTYTALIDSFGRSGNIEESLRLFNDMKQRQIRPSIYIYRLLIDNLKKMGKIDLAITLSEEMDSSLLNLAGPRDFKRKAR